MPTVQFTKRKKKLSGKYYTPGDRAIVTVEKANELLEAGEAKLVNKIKASGFSESESKTKNEE